MMISPSPSTLPFLQGRIVRILSLVNSEEALDLDLISEDFTWVQPALLHARLPPRHSLSILANPLPFHDFFNLFVPTAFPTTSPMVTITFPPRLSRPYS